MYYNRLGGENYASKRRITGMPVATAVSLIGGKWKLL